MTFHIQVNEEDYIQFNIYHAFHSKQGKKTLLLGRLLCFFFSACIITILLLAGIGRSLLLGEIVGLLVISTVWCLTYSTHTKKRIRKAIQAMKKEGKLPYNEEATIEFGETEIVESTAREINKTAYSEIIDICETEDYLYLKKGAVNYIILPIRCLEGKAAELADFIRKKTSQV